MFHGRVESQLCKYLTLGRTKPAVNQMKHWVWGPEDDGEGIPEGQSLAWAMEAESSTGRSRMGERTFLAQGAAGAPERRRESMWPVWVTVSHLWLGHKG